MVGNTVCSSRTVQSHLDVDGAVCYAVRLWIRGGVKRQSARGRARFGLSLHPSHVVKVRTCGDVEQPAAVLHVLLNGSCTV